MRELINNANNIFYNTFRPFPICILFINNHNIAVYIIAHRNKLLTRYKFFRSTNTVQQIFLISVTFFPLNKFHIHNKSATQYDNGSLVCQQNRHINYFSIQQKLIFQNEVKKYQIGNSPKYSKIKLTFSCFLF